MTKKIEVKASAPKKESGPMTLWCSADGTWGGSIKGGDIVTSGLTKAEVIKTLESKLKK